MLGRLFETRDDVHLLVVRVTLGVVMFPHGAQKLLGWFDGPGLVSTITGFREGLGIPLAIATLVIVAEFLGSLALLAGLLTRIAAFGIGAVMLGAAMVHWPQGFFMNWTGTQNGEGIEYHLMAMGLAFVLVMQGGGRWSLDRLSTSWTKDRAGPN